MADYKIPTYPAKRLRYYNNQFLNEKDFIDDQARHIAHAQAYLRTLCVAGVCEGLTLRIDAAKKLQVAPGVAIDRSGQLLALELEKEGPAATALPDGKHLVLVTFNEEESDPANPPAGGAPGMTRWHQAPVLSTTPEAGAVPAGAIVLGTATVAQAAFTAVSASGRRYSGLRLPGPSPTTTATLANRGDGSADGAQLTGDLAIRHDQGAGKLGPTLTLTNGAAFPGGAGSGAAIDFNAFDPLGNAPALRLQSLGDNAGSSHLVVSTRRPGGSLADALIERVRLTSAGVLKFTNDVQDKLVIADGYGVGLATSNLALFCPQGGHLSLRQGSSTGAEVFTVSGTGAATFNGGATFGGGLSVTGSVAATGTVSWGDSDTRTESRNDAGLQGNAGARSGFYQTSAPVNFPPGATSWWHLLDVRHSNSTNNYALQIAGAFFDQALWYRKTNNSPTTAWRQFVTADTAGNATVAARLSVSGAATFGLSSWNTYGTDSTIVTDNASYKAMMIVGSDQGQGHGRWIRMWDDVQVERNLAVAGSLSVGGDMQLGGKHALRGNDSWLRLNQDGAFSSGVHTPHKFAPNSLNVGGGGAAGWDTDPGAGNAVLKGTIAGTGGVFGELGLGYGDWHGSVPFPYESLQLGAAHNLRFYFGTTQRAMLENGGQFTLYFPRGKWVFQDDGNLVKYRNDGQVVWALNRVSGKVGWDP